MKYWVGVICLVTGMVGANFLPAASAGSWQKLGTNETGQLEWKLERDPFDSQPAESSTGLRWQVELPTPSGTLERFEIEDAGILPAELQARFPRQRAFRGHSLDGHHSVRLESSDPGLNAMIHGPDGTSFIKPSAGRPGVHAVYQENEGNSGLRECHPLEGAASRQTASSTIAPASTSGQNLRVFRIAITASGEFSQANGGTKSSTLAAIVTILNRVNEIYERELAVRLELATNNDQIVYLNPATDPFTRNDSSELTINEAHTNLLSTIGTANFDLGMAFNTSLYGLAYVRAVCDPTIKGRGVIGTATTTSEHFYRVVAHEIGHQFGASHTFNGNQGHCAIPRNAWSAWEPGSGSTVMAYSGIGCLSDELQPINDTYFHTGSYQEIQSFLTLASCARLVPTGNRPPNVSAGPGFVIPRGTPFRLTATATDPDSDPLVFCWEQYDLGPAQALNEPDNGQSPLFRSFPPVSSPTRTFPRWATLLTGQSDPAEKWPQTDRFLHFRVTARDQRSAGGGVAYAQTDVQIDASKGPFLLLAPNGGERWSGRQTIQWDPAGSAALPVGASLVNLKLSTNGGASFDHTLVLNTPNDGSEAVQLPLINVAQARVMVEAANNIFFDISDQGFEIVPEVVTVNLEAAAGASEIILRWTSLTNRIYRVQFRDSFLGGWSNLTSDLPGNGSMLERRDPIQSNHSRFYRLWLLP